MIPKFKHAEGFSVTINTNRNCTLKCSYCYESSKPACVEEDRKFWATTVYSSESRNYDFAKKHTSCEPLLIPIDKAKAFIDQVLLYPDTEFYKETVKVSKVFILDFIGGDALQYPDIVDQIVTYTAKRLLEKPHRWTYKFLVSISSNGITLLNPEARKLCEKWKGIISVGLSIDGCPELHDLNRWCFADNPDGSHRGSWQYIEKIWPWYSHLFPDDCLRTKWTLAPNSYKYLYDSIKFLHETLGMRYIFFNRVMEDDVLDTPEDVWLLCQQMQKTIDYIVEHHLDLCCETFSWMNTQSQTLEQQRKQNPNWSRCGFGVMPALGYDGRVYPCFRMLPGCNHLENPARFAQGTYDNLLANEDMLVTLNKNSAACAMQTPEKCKTCQWFTLCPHCAADCVVDSQGHLFKTTSVCNFTKLQAYYSRKYWETVVEKYPHHYADKYKISWTAKEQDDLLCEVLKEISEL